MSAAPEIAVDPSIADLLQDPDVAELIRDPEIGNWLRTHQGAAQEFKLAAKELANQPDRFQAIKKLLPALSEKTVHVFFSYKTRDDPVARMIISLLRKYSAGKLDITFQGEFGEEIAGRLWRQKIKSEVARANWFILLLPDPSEGRDWCLYEAGLFDRQATSADRLICLHHPNADLPDQITDYHTIPANREGMESFVKMVFLKKNPIPGLPAINEGIASEVAHLAADLVDAIRPPSGDMLQERLEPWLKLNVANVDELEKADDLDEAIIEDANEKALSIFGYRVPPRTWGALRQAIAHDQADARWLEELVRVVHSIGRGLEVEPIQRVFKAARGCMYRPVVHAIDRSGPRGPILSFHITFSEDIAALDQSVMPPAVFRLAAILRFAFRFRWEILERFMGTLKSPEDVEALETALRRMRREWESRGGLDEVQILELFPADGRRQRVLQMLIAWRKASDLEGTGALDVAITNRDPATCLNILKGFVSMNQQFLEIAADRFSDLMTVRAG